MGNDPITKAVSSGFQSVGSVLASIDPGPAIGNIGAQIDKAVNNVIPGGWIMVGALALTAISMGTINLEGEAMAAAAAAEASEAALAAGATAAEAAAAGQAAAAAATAGGAMGATGVGLTSGALDAALAVQTPLQAALQAAGTGALYGGAIGGGLSAIKGQDPIKGALMGALYGGLTGGALSGLESAGMNAYVAKALTSVATGAAKGQDVATILQNSALSTGLGAIANQANAYVNPVITNAGTGAIGSAIKGGDPLQGAISGAVSSLIGQGVGAVKGEIGSLTAPSAVAENINPATGQPWSETGSGLAGNGAAISLGANMDFMGSDLASRYLTAASEELSGKLSDLLPSIEEQRAELLDQADTVKANFDSALSAQSALKTALADKYNPAYENVLALQNTAKDLYATVTDLQNAYTTNKSTYESSNGSDTAAFNAANAAATQLNSLIPQYNAAAESFSAANTQLVDLYNKDIAPLYETYTAAQDTLNGAVKTFETAQNNLTEVVDTAASYVTGLNDISSGKLPTDYKAAELSMQAPTSQGFSDAELAAIAQGQQDAVNAAGTGSQTAATNNIGYVPPSTDVNYTGNNVQVSAPEGDLTDAEPIPLAPEEPIPEEPTPEEDLSQVILDSFAFGEGMTLQHMADDRWVVVDSNTGTALGEVNAPVEPTPVEPTPVEPTPVEPTPVEPTPVEPTPVEPTPVEPTPVEPTPVEPTPVEPDQAALDAALTDTTGTTPTDTTGTTPTDTTGTTPTDTTGTTPTDTTGTTPTDTTGTGGSGGPLAPFGAVDDNGNVMPGWSIDANGEWVYDPSTLPTTPEDTTGGTTGGTSTGTGGTSTGTGGTSTGTGGTSTGTGGTTSLPTMKAALSSSSRFADLTPQLTKATSFKFANEPTFSDQLTPMGNQTPFDYTSQILNAASGGSTSSANTIADLKPQLTQRTAFQFANKPEFNAQPTSTSQQNPFDYTQQILNAATGGLIQGYSEGAGVGQVEGVQVLRPQVTHGRRVAPFFQGAQLAQTYRPQQFAQGGDVEGHNPQFFSEGGLNSLENAYVKGEGDGTSDSVPAMLANGEFVIPADVVSKLGNGSNDAGADVLGEFLATIRSHAQNHDPKKLPPESKGALAYLLDAKRKVG